ncbi:MAG TPA: hypothetical protein VGL05_34305 [Kribbella sp.]
MIACFWEREDAVAVAERLGGVVRRERFHGEDDDEDHPWGVVLRDVDRAALDALLEEYDGWLEVEDGLAGPEGDAQRVARPQPGTSPSPAPLPTEPRRFKR